jgi:hypothetical protein
MSRPTSAWSLDWGGSPVKTSFALGAFGAALLFAPFASAYCRTTTCDPKDPEQSCLPNERGCIEEGLELIWPERCIHFGTQEDGSPLRGISYEAANQVIQEAFRQWISVDCGGDQAPSFSIHDLGEPYGGIVCDRPEFNQNAPNANVWMFRDQDWPYTGQTSTLALTTITFEVPTGEILDADVEINTFNIPITIGDSHIENDLLSIATHEAGHFLGLSHTDVSVATMNANYSPGDIEFRTLHEDDTAGICAIYPPDRDVAACSEAGPRPRHGFSRYCTDETDEPEGGCAIPSTASHPPSRGHAAVLVLLGFVAASRVARKRPRRR